MLIDAPVTSVVIVCSVGEGVWVLSVVVGVAIFLWIGVMVDVRVVVIVMLSLKILVDKLVKI